MPPLPQVTVTRPIPYPAVSRLQARATVEVLAGADDAPIPSADELARSRLVHTADILFTLPAHPITADVIAAAPKLKLIATMGTGFDNIDLGAARARGIVVSNAPGMLDETTADLTFALLLCCARQLPQAERHLRAGHFRGWTPFLFAGLDVHGRTLGIVGLGRIGQAVARRARGFGMRLLYSGPHPKPELERALGVERVPLDTLLADSDFVSLHVPLSPQTRHLIDQAALKQMKRTAVLINTSRGPVVDEAALASALHRGELQSAGLDVFEQEPTVHPGLLACDRAVLLPHIGSASETTRLRMAERAAQNVLSFIERGTVLDRVA